MGCGACACPPRVCFWLHPPSCAVNAKGNEQALVLSVAMFLRSAPCSCRENVVQECQEEASIPPELAAQAVPAGVVSYTALQVIAAHSKRVASSARHLHGRLCAIGHRLQAAGLKRDVLSCYDLRLPPDFVPQPQVLT